MGFPSCAYAKMHSKDSISNCYSSEFIRVSNRLMTVMYTVIGIIDGLKMKGTNTQIFLGAP